MATVIFNSAFGPISGRLGDVVFRKCGDRTIACRAPSRRRAPLTPRQLAHRDRFRQATFYARAVMADPASKAFYAQGAKATGKPLFSIATGDYLNPPVVDQILLWEYDGHAGSAIVIYARDDVEVIDVTVAILDMTGRVLESGPAVLDDGRWIYTASFDAPAGQPLTVEATATDRPRNTGTKSVPWVPTANPVPRPPVRPTQRVMT